MNTPKLTKNTSFLFSHLFLSALLYGQNPYEGTFMTQNGTVTLQLRAHNNLYQGVLQSTEGFFALQAKKDSLNLAGKVYTTVGNYDFSAVSFHGGLQINSKGTTYYFYMVSTDHQLGNMDLSPYFPKEAKGDSNENKGQPKTVSIPKSVPDGELAQYIAGSQLVFYQRTSYLNDSRASSLTYVNFCADGRFNLNYDGSFSVEGDYGGNAHGITRGNKYGTWQVTHEQGNPKITLFFANGEKGVYAVNEAWLKAGRWRIQNTQYALQRNKAVCR